MNVQIPIPKGAGISFESWRALEKGGAAEDFWHFGFVILSSFLIRISSLAILENQQTGGKHQMI